MATNISSRRPLGFNQNKRPNRRFPKSWLGAVRFILIAMLFGSGSPSGAQTVNTDLNGPADTGFPGNAIIHGSGFDNVRINNGNLHMEIPVTTVTGRGESITYKYVYDSKGWQFIAAPNVPPPQGPVGRIVPGVTQRFRFVGGPPARLSPTEGWTTCSATP